METARLILRKWLPEDLVALAAINQDPRVMEFLGPALSVSETQALIDRFCVHFEQHGYGPWACILKATGTCIGFVGLHVPSFQAAFTPCTEVLWRLSADYWGRGYATEAAKEVLKAAFGIYRLSEVVSFTARENLRSRRVMEKLGMRRDPKSDFHHPRFPENHPLSFHVFYCLNKDEYFAMHANSEQDAICLVDYDPTWPECAQAEIAAIKNILPANLVKDVQHIGSTAVPGLKAKPVIDILVGVSDLKVAAQVAIQPLMTLGYQPVVVDANQDRLFLAKGLPPQGTGRTHHVHIVEHAGKAWEKHIYFRDYLITHPQVAREYERLKVSLSEQFRNDREAYVDRKSVFIEQLLASAMLG